jgi:hypothetical protein
MPDLQKYTGTPAKGSIKDVADRNNQSVADAMMEAEVIVIVDVSSSMGWNKDDDYSWEPTGKDNTRWHHANVALENLQRKFDGKIIVMDFGDEANWRLDGNIAKAYGGTNLTDALELAKDFDGVGMKFIVISDGEPNNQFTALAVAKQFTDPIDTIYIGPASGQGEQFLRSLATGKALDKTDPALLEEKVTLLLGN